VATLKNFNLLLRSAQSAGHVEKSPVEGSEFVNDWLEAQTRVSALTNCGGFSDLFSSPELSRCGLLTDFSPTAEVSFCSSTTNPTPLRRALINAACIGGNSLLSGM
jgi:hypothetical protein